MTVYNRNDVWRIKRSQSHLDKALDSLTRANGELRPKQFETLRKGVQHAIDVAESVAAEMTKATASAPPLDLNLDDEQEAAE